MSSERCDFYRVAGQVPWLFERDRSIVVAGQLDGVVSALLLNAAVGCRVVGILAGNTLWVRRGLVKCTQAAGPACSEATFLDWNVINRAVHSIGHDLPRCMASIETSCQAGGVAFLNPNLLRRKKAGTPVRRMYPFGTIHFLLPLVGCVTRLSFRLPPPMLAFLMHVHSCFARSLRWPENALDWLEWLGASERWSPLRSVCKDFGRLTSQRMFSGFGALAEAFKSWGLGPRSQGELKDPNSALDSERLRSLTEWLHEQTGWPDPFRELRIGLLERHELTG
jgi:hypothetical protein